MYGELNIRPWELIRMTFRDVILAIEGLRDRDLVQQLLLRRSTFIIASATGGKKVAAAINRLWPVPKRAGGKSLQEMARERLELEKELDDKRKIKRMLNGRGVKTTGNG